MNEKQSSHRSTTIVSDRSLSSHGGILLVIYVSIVLLLISKGASVSPLFPGIYCMTLKNHLLADALSRVLVFNLYRIIRFLTGSTKQQFDVFIEKC